MKRGPGHAARPSYCIPIASLQLTRAAVEPSPDPYAILLVEDQVDHALLIQNLLSRASGFTTIHCQDGERAMQLVEAQHFDLVITDINLPGLGGLGLTRQVAEHHPGLPVLVTTGYTSPEYSARAREAGAVAVVLKPIDRDELLDEVRSALNIGKRGGVIAVGARPGDVELGCGGTLLAHRDRGEPVVIILPDDESPGSNEMTKRSAAMMGARVVQYSAEHGVSAEGGLGECVSRIVDEIEPDVAYVPSPQDQAPDRCRLEEAASAALGLVPNLVGYLTPTSRLGYRPDRVVGLRRTMNRKLQLISMYRDLERPELTQEFADATARYWGRMAHFSLVEPLELLRTGPLASSTVEESAESIEGLAPRSAAFSSEGEVEETKEGLEPVVEVDWEDAETEDDVAEPVLGDGWEVEETKEGLEPVVEVDWEDAETEDDVAEPVLGDGWEVEETKEGLEPVVEVDWEDAETEEDVAEPVATSGWEGDWTAEQDPERVAAAVSVDEASSDGPQTSRRRLLVPSALVVVLVLAGLAWAGWIANPTLSSSSPGSADEVETAVTGGVTESPVEASSGAGPIVAEAGVVPPEPSGELQAFSVAIGSFPDRRLGEERRLALERRRPDLLFLLAPVNVSGRVYQRLLAGPALDSAEAEALRLSLAESLSITYADTWILRRAHLAFDLGDEVSLEAARTAAGELRADGVPAYVMELTAGNSSVYRVYAGAYADASEAAYLGSVLADRGLGSSQLGPRVGRPVR